jgi:hypothetical protein
MSSSNRRLGLRVAAGNVVVAIVEPAWKTSNNRDLTHGIMQDCPFQIHSDRRTFSETLLPPIRLKHISFVFGQAQSRSLGDEGPVRQNAPPFTKYLAQWSVGRRKSHLVSRMCRRTTAPSIWRSGRFGAVVKKRTLPSCRQEESVPMRSNPAAHAARLADGLLFVVARAGPDEFGRWFGGRCL